MKHIFFGVILSMLSVSVYGEEITTSDLILSAVQVNKSKSARLKDFHQVIGQMIRQGYVGKKFDAKEDYTEQQVVRKPLNIFRNHVLVIGQEREGKYIGCCFENRTSIIMRATSEINKLRDFAKDNACQIYDDPRDQDPSKDTLARVGIKEVVDKLIQLFCADTDLGSRLITSI